MMATSLKETLLLTILSSYNLTDTFYAFNLDLFFPPLSDKTFELKSGEYSGGKDNKVRFIGMIAASVTTTKLTAQNNEVFH